MKRAVCGVVVIAIVLAGVVRFEAAESKIAASTKVVPEISFSLLDLNGLIHPLGLNDERRVRVFVFLSIECPIANSYTKTLNDLSERLGVAVGPKVDLFGVVSDATVTRAQAAQHFGEFKAGFPVLFDASGLLARSLSPTHVPEAFVLDREGRLVYRGAIDNAWEAIGRRRPKAERHFLADAIQAAMTSQPVAIARTQPVGCLFEDAAKPDADANVTYCRDIAPIMFARCLNCHREGQVAPFALASFDQTAKHAAQIVEVTQQRIMPPWMPNRSLATSATGEASSESSAHHTERDGYVDGNIGKFVGDRRLTDRELELLRLWSETGRAKGDEADLPPAPKFAEGWRLGVPDLVVKMTEPFSVKADGPDLLQNFVIPIEIAEDKLVSAIEFHPGNKRVVHHAVLFLDDKGHARKLDAATPEPGYGNFGGPGFSPSGALGGWSVGNTARHLPNEMGRYLKQGSDLVVQVHYHPTGKVEVDQSEIGIYFVKKPVAESLKQAAKLVGSIWVANYEMDIPVGEKSYRRSTSYVLPRDVIIVGVVPHMHLLGKSMRVTATLPEGSRTRESSGRSRSSNQTENAGSLTTSTPPSSERSMLTLIDVPRWNYNWQDEYYYERPFQLPAGTQLTVEAIYDNSADNPSNPSSPPKRVTWGDETTDEMLFCFFLLTADKTEDLIHTIYDNLGHDLKQPRAPVEKK